MRLICAIVAFAASLGSQIVAGVVTDKLICISRIGNSSVEIWRLMREALEAKDGDAYAANLKGAKLPKFPATILAMNGDQYFVSITDGKTPDAVIRLTGFWKGNPLRIGTELEFEGVGDAVMKDPLRLVIAVDPAKLEVLEKSSRNEGTICRCYTREEFQKMQARERPAPR